MVNFYRTNLIILHIILFLFTFGFGQGNTVTDIDGNVYETVQIGDQLWMAENLKTTHYRNGASIPYVENNWGSNTAGAYTFFDNLQSNANIYGNLYNGYAVYDDRGICPESWHVPTEDEFVELSSFLGDNAGGKLKEEGLEHWNSPFQ